MELDTTPISSSIIDYTLIKEEAEKLGSPEDVSEDFVCLDDVVTEEIDWLWFPYIAKKKLTIFTGAEGIGKSFITCGLASIVSNGGHFPYTNDYTPEGKVLFLAAEDGLEDTLKPRLEIVQAKQKNIFSLTAPITFDEIGLLRFYSIIQRIRPTICFIDPFFSYLKGGLNINLSTEIRPVTTKLAEIAAEFNMAMVLVRHIGKAKGGGDGRAAGLGSIDLRAVARSEIIIGRDPDNLSQGALIQDKNNLAECGQAVGYEIKNNEFYWLDSSGLTIEKILALVKNDDEESRSIQVEAMAFLRESLRDGERSAKDIKREAAGIGISEQNLRTARAKMKVQVIKRGNAFSDKKEWVWLLPPETED